MKTCPYCSEEIRESAIKCRWCGSRLDRPGSLYDWHRSRHDRMLAGVCGGLAEEFGVPTALVRLGFVLATLFMGGIGVLLYVALWVVMPTQPGAESGAGTDEASDLYDRFDRDA